MFCRWQGSQQEAELDQWNSEEQVEVEELLLTNPREILQRITMKSEVWPRPLTCPPHTMNLTCALTAAFSGGGGARGEGCISRHPIGLRHGARRQRLVS